ncbi:Two-component hybrid sensor and regulator [Planctomycetales bacterium 10988]|nr:Two-component hybrid sensor and regulator [Planctomycetales bacterium 10988]
MASQLPTTNLEDQVRSLQARLAQAQKMATLGELSSTITHEFNNILTTTINYAKLGLRHQDDATREKAFQKILSASQRAAKITSSILAVARNRGERFDAVELEPLIEDTLLLLEKELNKYRIKVERDFDKVPKAWINAGQIQQVMMNLIINARQAMEQGGLLWISVKEDAENGMVDLKIRDNGCGIPREQLMQIFEPFYTTKSGPDASGKGGTGIGLSMCREILENHHGKIRVESTVGKGTAFTLKLPMAKATERQDEAQSGSSTKKPHLSNRSATSEKLDKAS